MKKVIFILFFLPIILNLYGDVFLKTSFKNGAKNWIKNNQAFISSFSRRKGGKSIMIKQEKDEDMNSYWLSPPIPNPGKPIKLTFWAADNYLKCPDFSYSACVDIVNYDEKGKEIGTSWFLASIVWNEERKESMWGKLLPTGLVWKYYERTYTPKGKTFRIKFHWRKPIVRGECYLTDIMITEAKEAKKKEGEKEKKNQVKKNYALEISTPVTGNLFYKNDPLEFEIMVYSLNGKPIKIPEDAILTYKITDFQEFFISKGEFDFKGAKPVSDKKFYKSRVGRKRKFNLHKKIIIDDERAKETGREFFINVNLVSDGKTIASDTVTYAVVNPEKTSPSKYNKCRFSASNFFSSTYPVWRKNGEGIAEKMGISWNQIYDYGWKNCQPHYPGPIKFGKKLPPFPRVTYCPNIEQERTNKKWIRDEVPPEAIIPDPLHPGRITFKIDPYVEYIMAYIRHNHQAIDRVVPSGLEREIDSRTIELHKKVYEAIKKEFPEIKVGFMLYGLTMNPSSDVDLFLKEKLYKWCDFLDTHIYSSSIDWTEWERLKSELKKAGRDDIFLVSTEFSKVGGMDQIGRSRSIIAAHLDAFAHGMNHIYYFNVINNQSVPEPFLRQPTDLGSTQESGFLFMQRVVRPKVSDDIVLKDYYKKWIWWAYLNDSIMPLLQTTTYYNLVQNFETSTYRKTIHPDKDTIGYIFDKENKTIVSLWLKKPVGRKNFILKEVPSFTVCDLFGRKKKIFPVNGISIITVDENPLTLLFDSNIKNFQIEQLSGNIQIDTIPPGTSGKLTINIDSPFDGEFTLSSTVDGYWPDIKNKKVKLKKGKKIKTVFPVKIKSNQKTGNYPLTVNLISNNKIAGFILTELNVGKPLKVEIETIPLTKKTDPAIVVKITNFKHKRIKGKVIFDDKYFSTGYRDTLYESGYTVNANKQEKIIFPVNRNLVNLATSYNISALIKDTSGIEIEKEEEIGFRACEKAKGKIKIDGDLSDWNLNELTPIPFEREFTSWGKKIKDRNDLSGKLYTLWDKNYLYFGVIVKDNSHVQRYNDISIWADDNIMFGLYPWGWRKGETLHSGYYREHLGLCADGVSRIFRVGAASGGSENAKDAKICVRKTKDGYIYEWAYPEKLVFPLELKKGSKFRISMFILDRDKENGKLSALGGIQIGGFNENVDARPEKWREFTLKGD